MQGSPSVHWLWEPPRRFPISISSGKGEGWSSGDSANHPQLEVQGEAERRRKLKSVCCLHHGPECLWASVQRPSVSSAEDAARGRGPGPGQPAAFLAAAPVSVELLLTHQGSAPLCGLGGREPHVFHPGEGQ